MCVFIIYLLPAAAFPFSHEPHIILSSFSAYEAKVPLHDGRVPALDDG